MGPLSSPAVMRKVIFLFSTPVISACLLYTSKTKDQIQSNTTKINNIDQRVTTIETNIDQKIEGSKIKVEGDPDTGVTATEVKKGDKVTGYKLSLIHI